MVGTNGRNMITARVTSEYTPPADISGRVTSTSGMGIANVSITLTGGNQPARFAITNAFGYYGFTGLPSNEYYAVRVSSKRYRFQPPVRQISLINSFSEMNFIGDPGTTLLDNKAANDLSSGRKPGR